MTDPTDSPEGAAPRPHHDVTVDETWHTPRWRGRRRRVVVLGACAMVCVASLAVVVSSSVGGRGTVTFTEPSAVAADRPPALPSGRVAAVQPSMTAPLAGDRWEGAPAGPMDEHHSSVTVWTGEEYLVWGGEEQFEASPRGAAYDPISRTWTELPLALIAHHTPTGVWTGEELIVCCGDTSDRPNAAAYDPVSDSWRVLPKSPREDLDDVGSAVATWTGEEMIVVGGLPSPETDLSTAVLSAAYDPTTDAWTDIAEPPVDLGQFPSATWTGDELVVWPDRGGPGWSYDPAGDAWERLPDAPDGFTLVRPSAVWTGEEVLVLGGNNAGGHDTRLVGAAFDPASRTWRDLVLPLPEALPHDGTVGSQEAAWTGHQLVLFPGGFSSALPGTAGIVLAYTPSADRWDRLPDTPEGHRWDMMLAGGPLMNLSQPAEAMAPVEAATPATPPFQGDMGFSPPTEAASPTEEWVTADVGMTDGLLSTNGRITLSDDDRVYVANGFGETANVTALSTSTGDAIWERSDLVANTPSLQAVISDTLIISGQESMLRAVTAATGEDRWTVRFPRGYGAVGSVVVGQILFTTTDASANGDTRPPVVYGFDLATGHELWRSALTEDTALQWHAPTAGSGVIMVASTLSDPGSASGNMVHAVEADTGAIRWAKDLGGGPGFNWSPTPIGEDVAFLTGPEEVVAVDLATGDELWVGAGARPLAIAGNGDLLATAEEGVVRFDAVTGTKSVISDLATARDGVWSGTLHEGQLILYVPRGITAIDPGSGDVLWEWATDDVMVDLPSLSGRHIAIPTADRAVSLFTIPEPMGRSK